MSVIESVTLRLCHGYSQGGAILQPNHQTLEFPVQPMLVVSVTSSCTSPGAAASIFILRQKGCALDISFGLDTMVLGANIRNVRQLVCVDNQITCRIEITAAESLILKGSCCHQCHNSPTIGVSGNELALCNDCKSL